MGVLWAQEIYYRDLDKKTALFLLAYPISRSRYLLARFTGVLCLLSVATVLVAAPSHPLSEPEQRAREWPDSDPTTFIDEFRVQTFVSAVAKYCSRPVW